MENGNDLSIASDNAFSLSLPPFFSLFTTRKREGRKAVFIEHVHPVRTRVSPVLLIRK